MSKIMPASQKNFTENLWWIIEEYGLTIKELGDGSGTGAAGMSRVLHMHDGITLDRVDRIAEFLGIESYKLLSPHGKHALKVNLRELEKVC